MTLFIEDGAPVIVQGMTGHQGMTHTARMLKAGTNIVGGVNARKAGQEVNFPAAKDGEDVTLRVFGNCAEASGSHRRPSERRVRAAAFRQGCRGRSH